MAAAQAMCWGKREAPLAVQVRDRLGEPFPDAAFADAFGQAGKPGWSPGRLALVTVLQKAASLGLYPLRVHAHHRQALGQKPLDRR